MVSGVERKFSHSMAEVARSLGNRVFMTDQDLATLTDQVAADPDLRAKVSAWGAVAIFAQIRDYLLGVVRNTGNLYRVPAIADDLAAIRKHLDRMDARSRRDPCADAFLALYGSAPTVAKDRTWADPDRDLFPWAGPELPSRVLNIISSTRCRSARDLADYGETRLRDLGGCGDGTVAAIRADLRERFQLELAP